MKVSHISEEQIESIQTAMWHIRHDPNPASAYYGTLALLESLKVGNSMACSKDHIITNLTKASEMALSALLDAQQVMICEFSDANAYADEIEALRQALTKARGTE